MEEFINGIYLLLNIFCLTAAQNQYVYVQRWTNVLIRMELTQSISNQFCYLTKNTDVTFFTIIMGKMVRNIPDKRIMAVDKFVSSVVKLKINNVSYSDAGVYSIVSQSETKKFGGIQLVVTDYPVTEPPGNISSSTVGSIIGILIAVIISAIVAILLIIRRRRKNKMQSTSPKIICNGEVYANMKDNSPSVLIPPTQDNNAYVHIPTNQDNIVNIPPNQYNIVNIPTIQDNIVNIPTNQDNLQSLNQPTTHEDIDITADVKEEQPREEVYYSNNEQISQPNSEIEETTTRELVYIEVTFDDNKKTDDDTAIQITRDICARTTYEEVDFTATADLANT